MAVIVKGIRIDIDEPPQRAFELALRRLSLSSDNVKSTHMVKKSLDARRARGVRPAFICQVAVTLHQPQDDGRFSHVADVTVKEEMPLVIPSPPKGMSRPVIAGLGPAGLFAGLILARAGVRPLILEQGQDVDTRTETVRRLFLEGRLDTRSNIQFGEGGAGTFSDGKLTTRINDPLCDLVLNELLTHGAPDDIIYRHKPHIGTDLLREVVKCIRNEIVSLGGEVRFNTALEDIHIKSGRVTGITVNGEAIPCDTLILAAGHSARKLFSRLIELSVPMSAKAFSVGVRIEHTQSLIDRALYHELAGHKNLPTGEYNLSHQDGRGVYTFCMCPGGTVVCAASEQGGIVTNGMSEHARDGKNANCAIAVSVTPEDFGSHPLSGIEFQRTLERAAFRDGYCAPIQTSASFLGLPVPRSGLPVPTLRPGVYERELSELFPPYVVSSLKNGLTAFGRKLSGFDTHGILTAPETRTSSPVRILRGESGESVGVGGLFPCGEGAGYAGGIMSAAVDGVRTAINVIRAK